VENRFTDPEYQSWAKNVKIRDGYRCQVCSKRGGAIHAHHMNAWSYFTEQRYDLKNGVTLCTICHDKFHSVFGKGENTVFQFVQFKKMFSLIKKSFFKQFEENFLFLENSDEKISSEEEGEMNERIIF
jgi:predicted restriction endonuclease